MLLKYFVLIKIFQSDSNGSSSGGPEKLHLLPNVYKCSYASLFRLVDDLFLLLIFYSHSHLHGRESVYSQLKGNIYIYLICVMLITALHHCLGISNAFLFIILNGCGDELGQHSTKFKVLEKINIRWTEKSLEKCDRCS